MIVVFLPGFDRFNPGFGKFTHGFDRFIFASTPVTGTFTLQSKCTFINKMFMALYFDIILFEIIIFLIKKKHINSQNKYFPENTFDTNQRLSLSHFNATGSRLWSTGSERSQSSVINSMQEKSSEIDVIYKLVKLNIWNVNTKWFTRFHRNAFYGPEIIGNPIVYIGHLTFEIRARAAPHVITARGNSRLNKS